MVFWLKFSVSSANSGIKDEELFHALSFPVRAIHWRVKAKLSALEPRTRYMREGLDYPVFPTWAHVISLYEEQISSYHWQELPKRDVIVHVPLACSGALITPMSYPNWKEPSTAVKTVKTKVPVICGEWNTGLENTGKFSYPASSQSAAWTSDRLHRLGRVPWHSQCALCSQQGHSYHHVRTIQYFPYTANAEKSWGQLLPGEKPKVLLHTHTLKFQDQDWELGWLWTEGNC